MSNPFIEEDVVASTTIEQVVIVIAQDRGEEILFSTQSSFNIEEHTLAIGKVNASPLYFIDSGTDADKFVINQDSGVLSFIDPPDFDYPSDANSDNIYEVTVGAIQGVLRGVQALSIAVTNVEWDDPIITKSGKKISTKNFTHVILK